MRRIIAVVLLTGCAAVPVSDPCACIVIPDVNGVLSLSVDGAQQSLDGGDTPTTTGISAYLRSTADRLALAGGGEQAAWTSNGISVDANGTLGFSASWGAAETFDITRPAAISDFTYDTYILADVDFESAVAMSLGPRGGSAQVREIVPDGEDNWRVRGSYSAQVCEVDNPASCAMVTGTFAFDSPSLPTNGNVEALLPAG